MDSRLAAIIVPALFGKDFDNVLSRLRHTAGADAETLARVAGQIAGFSQNEHTHEMCTALITRIAGAEEWAESGRRARRAQSSLAPTAVQSEGAYWLT